jgi:hypothetical protein
LPFQGENEKEKGRKKKDTGSMKSNGWKGVNGLSREGEISYRF